MSDFIYYLALVFFAAMATVAFIWIGLRISNPDPQNDAPLAPYKLERPNDRPKAAPGDTVRLAHMGLLLWGTISRIDGRVYSVIISNVEAIPDDYPPEAVPGYGETVHVLDPHITFVFRAPVSVEV